MHLENTAQSKYVGVTFDRTLTYKHHIQNTNMNVATRNNVLNTLTKLKWGTNYSKNNGTGPVLLNHIIYAAPVWARSSHADILDT